MHAPSTLTSPEPLAILVRTPNWLGDLLLSTGFVRALMALFPEVKIDLVVRKGFQSLPLPHRGEVLAFDCGSLGAGAFGRGLRARKYSHLFVLPPSFSSAWMAWWSGASWRIGYRGEGRSWLLRPAMGHAAPARTRHLLQEYLDLLRPWADMPAADFPPGLDISSDWIEAHWPGALKGESPDVVMAPGAEYGPAKQWPLEQYAELARGLAAEGRQIIVTGLSQDRAAGGRMLAGVRGGRNLCGETSLAELTALLARARLVISNDSGAMHVAAALGRPQIALFGSTDPAWTSPVNGKARILYRAEPCSPCYERRCPLGHFRCLRGIPAGEVLSVAKALLQQPPP